MHGRQVGESGQVTRVAPRAVGNKHSGRRPGVCRSPVSAAILLPLLLLLTNSLLAVKYSRSGVAPSGSKRRPSLDRQSRLPACSSALPLSPAFRPGKEQLNFPTKQDSRTRVVSGPPARPTQPESGRLSRPSNWVFLVLIGVADDLHSAPSDSARRLEGPARS